MEETLSNIYFDINNPASFGSAYRLYKAAKKIDQTITLSKVKNWLSGQTAYVLHRSSKTKFPRRKTISKGLHWQWQGDIAVMDAIRRYNNNFRYILVNIDIFSRQATAVALKKKNATAVVAAYKRLFKKQTPKNLQTDLGKEFWNRPFRNLLKEHGVNFFSVSSDQKASLVERLIRTLKEKMFKYFTHNNTLNYISVLDSIVNAYNNKPHRSLAGLAPNQVNKKNERAVWERQYGGYVNSQMKNSKFKIGDRVVVTKIKGVFRKGYLSRYKDEHFTIIDQLHTVPTVWKLADERGDVIGGVFYNAELQKVNQ